MLCQMLTAKQLILSAGINVNQYGETADGLDRHFEVNFLGQFYVVNQLWPLLRKTAKMPGTPPPRVVFESSEQHRNAPKVVHFGSVDEINNPEIGTTEVYGRTKLAIILGVRYGLLERVIKPNKDNIYVLSVHPGAVRSFPSRLPVWSNSSLRDRSTRRCSSSEKTRTPGCSASCSRRRCWLWAATSSRARSVPCMRRRVPRLKRGGGMGTTLAMWHSRGRSRRRRRIRCWGPRCGI